MAGDFAGTTEGMLMMGVREDGTVDGHAAARGQVTRLKRRAANGVCPCCTRTFADLKRHMANQHPDFTLESDADATDALRASAEKVEP